MHTLLRKVRRTRGAAAIEFALTMPVIILLLSAVVDWGSYMTTRVTVARAAMDGARQGAATRESNLVADGTVIAPAARQRAVDVLAGMNKPCTAGICTVTGTFCAVGQASANCGSPPLQTVLVTVQYAYTPFFGFITTPAQLRESFMMVVEAQ